MTVASTVYRSVVDRWAVFIKTMTVASTVYRSAVDRLAVFI